MSALPFDFAAKILEVPGSSPTHAQIERALTSAMQRQGLQRTTLSSLSGTSHKAYPLWVPVQICDDRGEIGGFDALIAFVDGQDQSRLVAGLTGFLDKFDVHLTAREFKLSARSGMGIACPHSRPSATSP